MSEYVPLKYYFDRELAVRLSSLIKPFHPHFNTESFTSQVAWKVENKELKARVEVIADELRNHLPVNYEDALSILLNILGPENETEEGMFTNGYFLMPVAYFVEKYGHNHFDLSMNSLVEITKRHTSEYAIRPYLNMDIDRCIVYLQDWLTDSNAHVRRLVSEGTRPRLPWAKKIHPIKNDPKLNLNLLGNLLDDPSPYVQKSVANHINDLTKDYPALVNTWIKGLLDQQAIRNTRIIKLGLRTLHKNENQEAINIIRSVENIEKNQRGS